MRFVTVLLSALSMAAPIVRAELRLVCEVEGRTLRVASVENEKILLHDGEATIATPENATWHIEGDLRENAALVEWSPNYGITRFNGPDREFDPQRA